MGTTSDKLTYLNGTKQALKDSINNIGGSITDETTFRAYAEELDNIYDSLPKTTGEGSNLSLTTLKGRINVDDILGDTQQEGTPTPLSPQDINVVTGTQEVVVQNANYFKPQLKVDNTDILQIRCAVTLQDDEFTFVASGTDMYFGNVGTSGTSYQNNRGTLKKLPNNASKVYVTTTNTDFNANYICWYDENKTTLGFVLSNSAGNSIPSSAKYMNVRIGKADSVSKTTYKTKVMVRIDDNTTTYVPYQEQTKTLHLGDIELAKIGTYQDRIYKEKDKWYIEKNIGKVLFNGSENWARNYNQSAFYNTDITNLVPTAQSGTLYNVLKSDKFTECKYIELYNSVVDYGIGQTGSATPNLAIRVKDITTVADFKTWLSNNNTEVYYAIKTPTYTEITNETLLNELNELEKMYSYNGQTNISVSGNLPMILDVSALKGE